jgi:hypothetical protein
MVEVWKPVVGCEGSYEVSDHGRVRSLERVIKRRYRDGFRYQNVAAAILRPSASTEYLSVTLLGRKTRNIHDLVLEAFVGPRPVGGRYEALHKDGSRTNNNLWNLRWGTSKENKDDAAKHGVQARGEKCGAAKLDAEKVRAIRDSGLPLKYFEEAYGVSRQAICQVRNHQTWKHLP